MHNLLRTIVFAKHFGVHEHSARSGCVEPSEVEYRFGFTSTEEVPFAIDPSFDPSVIVVGMRPTRSINLSCRDAYRTKCSNEESRFFATTSVGSFDRGERRLGASIRWGVGYIFVAPVVDFEHSIVERKMLDARF